MSKTEEPACPCGKRRRRARMIGLTLAMVGLAAGPTAQAAQCRIPSGAPAQAVQVTADASACDGLEAAVDNARQASLEALESLQARASACVAAQPGLFEIRNKLSRRLAKKLYEDFNRRVRAGEDATGLVHLLERAQDLAAYWQVSAQLGHVCAHLNETEAAAHAFMRAVNEIADDSATPEAPPKEVVEELAGLAEEYRAVAYSRGVVLPLATNRDGSPVGVGAFTVRGVEMQSHRPIFFEYNSTAFTAAGQAEAEALRTSLPAQTERLRGDGKLLVMATHTDPRGSDAFNLDLSIRRAQALRGFLGTGHGDGQAVVLLACGETHPPVLFGRDLSEEEKHLMARRTQLRAVARSSASAEALTSSPDYAGCVVVPP